MGKLIFLFSIVFLVILGMWWWLKQCSNWLNICRNKYKKKVEKNTLTFSDNEWLFLISCMLDLRDIERQEENKAIEAGTFGEHICLSGLYHELVNKIHKGFSKSDAADLTKPEQLSQIVFTEDEIKLLYKGMLKLKERHENYDYYYSNDRMYINSHIELSFVFAIMSNRLLQQAGEEIIIEK